MGSGEGVGAHTHSAMRGGPGHDEIAGAGRQSKVKIDFDDDNIGRKTLVIAQANLETETD